MVRFASIRLILAIVGGLDLELHQMDLKTVFLNRELEEEIYMEQPIGFVKKRSGAQSLQAQTFNIWFKTILVPSFSSSYNIL